MQFSLRALMIGILFVALALVVPSSILRVIELIVWFLIPSVLVGGIMYGNGEQRAFASGSLATYVAMSWQLGQLMRMNMSIRWLILILGLGVAGWLTRWIERRLSGSIESPPAPPRVD